MLIICDASGYLLMGLCKVFSLKHSIQIIFIYAAAKDHCCKRNMSTIKSKRINDILKHKCLYNVLLIKFARETQIMYSLTKIKPGLTEILTYSMKTSSRFLNT